MQESEIESLFSDEKWYVKGKYGFIFFILIGLLLSGLISYIQIEFSETGISE